MNNYPAILAFAKNNRHNSNLAMLRMLLAVYVLLFHLIPRYAFFTQDPSLLFNIEILLARLLQPANETNAAVIAFITLSGYCIHRNGFRHDDMPIKAFLLKRCFRILPMVLLGTFLGVSTFFTLSYDPRIMTLTNTQTISAFGLFYKLSGIFAFVPHRFEELCHQGNGPLITAIVELWLYCFYPVGVLLIAKYGNRKFWSGLAVIGFAGIASCQFFPQIQSWWHNGSFFGFLVYWWIGVYSVDHDSPMYAHGRKIALGFGILSIVLLIEPSIFLAVELKKILFSLIVVRVLRWCDTHGIVCLRSWISGGSFSLYVLHVPLICWALFLHLSIPAAIVMILVIAKICYIYVEKPLIDLSQRISRGFIQSRGLAASSL